jgi:hypothetical protein
LRFFSIWEWWWGRWDLNPGSRTPQARILNHARRRPHRLDAPKEPNQIKKPISLEILDAIDGCLKAKIVMELLGVYGSRKRKIEVLLQ